MSRKEAIERAERAKKKLEAYVKLADKIGIDKQAQERTIDILLEDLSKALKELKE